MSRYIAIAVIALAAVFAPLAASAADIESTVRSVDATERTIIPAATVSLASDTRTTRTWAT